MCIFANDLCNVLINVDEIVIRNSWGSNWAILNERSFVIFWRCICASLVVRSDEAILEGPRYSPLFDVCPFPSRCVRRVQHLQVHKFNRLLYGRWVSRYEWCTYYPIGFSPHILPIFQFPFIGRCVYSARIRGHCWSGYSQNYNINGTSPSGPEVYYDDFTASISTNSNLVFGWSNFVFLTIFCIG